MSKPTIDYLNARKAALAASGGSKHKGHRYLSDAPAYCPDSDLDINELTEQRVESAWCDYRIRAETMWDAIFARAGLTRGYDVEETF
jgi:hypothetical protein